jgi:hypothetical protein
LKLLGEIIDRVTPKFLVRLLCSKIELTTIGSIDTSPSNSILTFGEGGAHIRSAIVQLLEAVVRFKDGDLAQKFGPFFDRLISAYFEVRNNNRNNNPQLLQVFSSSFMIYFLLA